MLAINPPIIVALKETQINGETVLNIGPAVLVKSKSTPDTWYAIEEGRCSCASFAYRGRCRHLAVAAIAAEQDRAEAESVKHPCPACGSEMAIGFADGPYCESCERPICPKCGKRPVGQVLGKPMRSCHICALRVEE